MTQLKKKFRTVRFEVTPELDALLEKDRMTFPVHQRPNKSAHIRMILGEYLSQKHAKKG